MPGNRGFVPVTNRIKLALADIPGLQSHPKLFVSADAGSFLFSTIPNRKPELKV